MDFNVVMMTSGFLAFSPEFVVTCSVSPWLCDQLQRRWWLEAFGPPGLFETTEAVQDVLLGRLPRLQGLGHGPFDLLLVME